TTTAALLGSALGLHASVAPPVGLNAQIASASLAGAAKPVGFSLLLRKILLMKTQTKITLTAVAVALVAAIPLALQYQSISRLEQDVTRLENERIVSKSELTRIMGELQDANARLQKLAAFAPAASNSAGSSPHGTVKLDLSVVEKLGFSTFDSDNFKLS